MKKGEKKEKEAPVSSSQFSLKNLDEKQLQGVASQYIFKVAFLLKKRKKFTSYFTCVSS